MKFVSKLYFNVFKGNGNLRLMFVVSSIFALVCFFIVTVKALDSVIFVNINNVSVQETLDSYDSYSQNFRRGTKLYKFVKVRIAENPTYSVKNFTNSVVVKKHCIAGMNQEAFDFAQKHFSDVGQDKEHSDPVEFCKIMQTEFLPAYTFKYLWNYLWVIFWFYLPFLLVLPIKFIVDGYAQDKKKK